MTTTPADVINKHAILVHSRVRWATAEPPYRRRFEHAAQSRDILFVEAPYYLDDLWHPSLDWTRTHTAVHRVVPHLPAAYRDHEAASLMATRTLLVELVGTTGALAHRFDHPIHWFDSPLAAPIMLGAFDERLVVYDRRHTPAPSGSACIEWLRRERVLMARADVILSHEHSSTDALLELLDQRLRAVPYGGAADARGVTPRHIHSRVAR